ncbi:MAG TPA: prepilin peptidase [Solirubrobacteraceae bacterium]|nr:prepilin peptidase [Solirubrobacteraceae bacterium]
MSYAAVLIGAIFGSFFNVVAYRLPRGESLAHPPSRCPGCETPIKPYDNVPILSWLALRGKCRACGTRISARYPLVEAGTAVLCGLVVLVKGPNAEALLGVVMVMLLVPVTLIDLDHRIIPNKLMILGAVLAPPLVVLADPDAIVEHLIAGAAAGTFFLLAVLAYPRGMGVGDIKLAAVLGLFLGRAVGPAVFIALVSGTLVGALIMARKGVAEGRKTAVPFGPFLALGGVVALFAGDAMVDAYLATFN